MPIWIIFQELTSSGTLKDGIDHTFTVDYTTSYRTASAANFKDVRGSRSSWPHDSSTKNKDPSINWANPEEYWEQKCGNYDIFNTYCDVVRYRFYRNFETSQPNEDIQFSIDPSFCDREFVTWLRWVFVDKE